MTNTTWSNVIRGVAYGDAWGNRNEFQKISSLIANNPKGPELPEALEITDDTQMTLFLAHALDASYDLDEQGVKDAIIEAFLDYNVDPDNNRAPGVTVTSSLSALARQKDLDWTKATSKTSDGSGTVMRTSPVAFVAEDRWVGIAAFAAAVTHGTPNAIAAAILNVAILREIIAGKLTVGNLVNRALELAESPFDNGLTQTGTWIEGLDIDLLKGFDELARLLRLAQKELPILAADPWDKDADPSLYIGRGGWRSHETLVIALLAVDMLPSDGWEALRRSVVSDGDSDTIGAVAGALVGALGTEFPDVIGRLEPRFRRWIELEADDYDFETQQAQPAATPKWRRWLGLNSVL